MPSVPQSAWRSCIVLGHLYSTAGKVCHFNLMLFYPWLSDQEVLEADASQAEEEKAALKKLEHRKYTGILAGQGFGPLKKFLIPMDHSRCSYSRLVQSMLYDEAATQCIDYDALEHLVCTGSADAEEEVPIAFIPMMT